MFEIYVIVVFKNFWFLFCILDYIKYDGVMLDVIVIWKKLVIDFVFNM